MKARPVILVIVTLIIGIIIGMLTSAQIRLNKLRPVRFYFSHEQFREGFYKMIEADEKQKIELAKIMDKYEILNDNLLQDYRKGFESNVKAMEKELNSILTKEQTAKLKEMEERRQEMFRQARRNFDRDSVDGRNFDRRDGDMRRRPGSMPPGVQGPPPGNRPSFEEGRQPRDRQRYQPADSIDTIR
jgi:uncharacterized membrane-anchored protein YhcB (DUF1043 family)